MKKLSFLLLAIVILFATYFISCEKNTEKINKNNEVQKIITITPLTHPSLDLAIDGFLQGLIEKGYDKNKLDFVIMNANGDFSKIPSLTKSAISKKPKLIFVLTTPAASTAIKITNPKKIPIVYTAVTDPVSAGIVSDMNNSTTLATGVSDRYPVEEQVKVFINILPSMKSAAIIYNPSEENSQILVKQTIKAMKDIGVNCFKFEIRNASEISSQTKQALSKHDCIIVNGDNLATENLSIIINLCIKYQKPLFVGDPDSVRKGAVATVGPSYYSLGIRSGYKAAKILNGTSPKVIPSEYPNSFDYILNTDAAKKMGVSVPNIFWDSRSIWESNAKTK